MAYQPPGPYPIMPMQAVPGMPGRPPIPKAALRSSYAILIGAVLSAASLVVTIADFGTLRSEIMIDHSGISTASVNEIIDVALVAMILGGLVKILLWAWMAWKIRTGRHWARVLSTVFFGIAVAGQLIGNTGFYANLGGDNGQTNSVSTPHPVIAMIIGWASVAAGLYAMVLFWQKSNAAFFRPQQFLAPAGYPYPYPFPPQGYPGAPYPQAPAQAAFASPQEQPQPPADPWSTPPQQ